MSRQEMKMLHPRSKELVHCRDCIHFHPPLPSEMESREPCCDGQMVFAPPDPEGFCAWGRRREEVQ